MSGFRSSATTIVTRLASLASGRACRRVFPRPSAGSSPLAAAVSDVNPKSSSHSNDAGAVWGTWTGMARWVHRGASEERSGYKVASRVAVDGAGAGEGFARRGIFGGVRGGKSEELDEKDLDELEAGGEGEEEEVERPKDRHHLLNKPEYGVNRWRYQRKRQYFIARNARTHADNKKARAREREAKRVEKWRMLAANARAWEALKKSQAKSARRAALKQEREEKEKKDGVIVGESSAQ